MADDSKRPIIIVKKKRHEAHPPHGGAWKVAYADFVTAMMAFFLVMWLLGADEETKASIAAYFNNPSAPPLSWRPELKNKDNVPLGIMVGAGDSVLRGADGHVPEDLAKRPLTPPQHPTQGNEPPEVLDQLLKDEQSITMDMLRVAISEDQLFEPGSTDHWKEGATSLLDKLGKLASNYGGRISIRGSYDRDSKDFANSLEFQNARAVSVVKYLTQHHWSSEDRLHTSIVHEATQLAEGDEPSPNFGSRRKLVFELSKTVASK